MTHLSALFSYMRRFNIGLQLNYTPDHLHPYYRDLVFSEEVFPNAELYGNSAMTLPLYPSINAYVQIFGLDAYLLIYL